MSARRRRAFDDLVKSLANEIGREYGPTLHDFQSALDGHRSAVKVILNMKKSDRAAAINSLADSVTDWLKKRDQRWAGLGARLGASARKALKTAFGV